MPIRYPGRPTHSQLLRTGFCAVAVIIIAGCSTALPDDSEQITWYAVNPGGALRINLYDLVCGRQIANLRLSSRRETAVSTCADENGRAYVRYRPRGYSSRMETWTYNRINANQRVYVQ